MRDKSTGLARNHRALVKFESLKDPQYQLVKPYVQRIVLGAGQATRYRLSDIRQAAMDTQTYRSVLDTLHGPDMFKKHKSLEKASKDAWIVRGGVQEYAEWVKGPGAPGRQHLWIYGPEGKGKSAAAAAIISDIKERNSGSKDAAGVPQLTAYFFCDDTPD